MMQMLSLILADADDIGPVIKVAVVIIILIASGIRALLKLGKTQSGKQSPNQAAQEEAIRAHWEDVRRREAARALGQMPPPMAPPPLPPMRNIQRPAVRSMSKPAPQPVRRPQAQVKQKKGQRRVQPPALNVPALPAAARKLTAYDTPGVVESEIAKGSAPASPARRQTGAAVQSVIRLTPQSLRQQFILTEILLPPLALREPK